MRTVQYNRNNTIEYAKKWAMNRNPAYYDFDGGAGIAQILHRNVFLPDVML